MWYLNHGHWADFVDDLFFNRAADISGEQETMLSVFNEDDEAQIVVVYIEIVSPL